MKPPFDNLPNRESRFLSASVELRAAAETDKTPIVRGYAAKFDARSENLGGSSQYQFYEIIKPGAFDDVLNDDVRALFNHESSAILARSKGGVGSLTIGTDEVGLWYEFEAPDTQVGRDLVTSLKRGDVDQSSFSFTVNKDGEDWNSAQDGDGPMVHTRTIKKVSRLYDVSPVTYPAYPDATVALRSLQEFQAAPEPTPEPSTPSQEESRKAWAAFHGFKATPPANQ
jgi:HK97 family phage prohead protease